MWRTDLLIEAAEAAVQRREAELAAEHAVHGLDSFDEVELHPLLAAGFTEAGLGVLREQPYPHEWRSKRGRRLRGAETPEHRDRLRCDLVLTPSPGQRLVDPLLVERESVRARRNAEGTLSSPMAGDAADAVAASLSEGVGPRDVYWMEVKVVGQHAYCAGVPGPNRSYASELRRTLTDLRKLEDDEQVLRAGLLLVVFAEERSVAEHDLSSLMHACLDREIAISSPELRHVPIHERIGNRVCTLCLADLRKSWLAADEMDTSLPL